MQPAPTSLDKQIYYAAASPCVYARVARCPLRTTVAACVKADEEGDRGTL